MARSVKIEAEAGSGFGYTPLRDTHWGRLLDYCHRHNLVDPETAGRERPFGIRVTLPPGDTLRNVLGDDWERLHWYPSESERDEAFESMAKRHGYYRTSDSPTQILEKILR